MDLSHYWGPLKCPTGSFGRLLSGRCTKTQPQHDTKKNKDLSIHIRYTPYWDSGNYREYSSKARWLPHQLPHMVDWLLYKGLPNIELLWSRNQTESRISSSTQWRDFHIELPWWKDKDGMEVFALGIVGGCWSMKDTLILPCLFEDHMQRMWRTITSCLWDSCQFFWRRTANATKAWFWLLLRQWDNKTSSRTY